MKEATNLDERVRNSRGKPDFWKTLVWGSSTWGTYAKVTSDNIPAICLCECWTWLIRTLYKANFRKITQKSNVTTACCEQVRKCKQLWSGRSWDLTIAHCSRHRGALSIRISGHWPLHTTFPTTSLAPQTSRPSAFTKINSPISQLLNLSARPYHCHTGFLFVVKVLETRGNRSSSSSSPTTYHHHDTSILPTNETHSAILFLNGSATRSVIIASPSLSHSWHFTRLPTHLTRHDRRFYNTKSKRTSYTFVDTFRPIIHITTNSSFFRTTANKSYFLWCVQSTSAIPLVADTIRCSKLLCLSGDVARSRWSWECAEAGREWKGQRKNCGREAGSV